MRKVGVASPVPGAIGKWALQSSYDRALVALCKSTPGLRWLGKVWVGYRDAMVALSERAAAQGLEVIVRDASKGWTILPGTMIEGLRDYQREGVAFLIRQGQEGCILGDAMGLGKTLTTLGAAQKVTRLLVVCPSYVRSVWVREIERWTSRGAPFLPEGVSKKRAPIPRDCTTIVIHYDILHAWAAELSAWVDAAGDVSSAVAFDEGHMLQSEGSKRGIAAREIAKNADYKWVLTGTPLANRPKDLWNTVDVVSPGRLGGFFSFGLRYCDAHQENVTPEKVVWKFEGKSNLEELGLRCKEFMVRRTVQDVGMQLPPKTRQIIYLDVGKRARLMPEGRDGASLRRSLASVADEKIPGVWELLLAHLEAGLSVVVFTWRREVAELLGDRVREAGFGSEVVHGGVSHARRGAAIERAKSAEGGSALVATIDSASVGVDFTFASVCLFAEIDYKPHALLQAEARIHRFGQGLPVLIQYALGKGTIDEVIAERVIQKLDTFESVVGKTGESLGDDLKGDEGALMGELFAAIEASK